MKAFSRSLFKIKKSKDTRRRIMILFDVLLNCYNFDSAFNLYEGIMNIYANPYNEQSLQKLYLLLNESNADHFPIEPCLDDGDRIHFLDETDITTDAITHESPFNTKACDRIPVLKQLISKELMQKKNQQIHIL